MVYCITKRILSQIDDSLPVFSLNNYKGYARITSVYDGDTFKACIILHGKVLKFTFRTLGYDAPEMKPYLSIAGRENHIQKAVAARELFKHEVGFLHSTPHQWWNPLICNTKVKGWVWIDCKKNDKYGRTLVTVYRKRSDTKSVNDKMIDSGLVNIYDGGTKQEFK